MNQRILPRIMRQNLSSPATSGPRCVHTLEIKQTIATRFGFEALKYETSCSSCFRTDKPRSSINEFRPVTALLPSVCTLVPLPGVGYIKINSSHANENIIFQSNGTQCDWFLPIHGSLPIDFSGGKRGEEEVLVQLAQCSSH